MTFGQWLDEAIREKHLTQKEFADRVGVSQAAVSKLISGRNSPSNEILKNTARVLRLPVEAVFRAAGILPPVPVKSELVNEILHIVENFDEEELRDMTAYARMRRDLREERNETQ